MCGVCGFISRRNDPGIMNLALLKSMTGEMIHRGPDRDGFYISGDKTVGLGFRRLSIIDLSTGDQPMGSQDGSIQVVFNGEIYNFHEIRKLLEAAGYIFRTNSDTETIIHAYEHYGSEFLEYLRGMFAIALYDEKQKKIILARDRIGKKPLYYAMNAEGLIFGSEIKSLLKSGLISREIDLEGLDLYLSHGYIPAPWTILAQVKKLPPAHTLTIDLVNWESEIYSFWDLSYTPKLILGFEDAKNQLLQELREAVSLRMISDVPLGALLSGGIDSSLIVALMAEQSSQKVKTFTIGFDDNAFDERPYARELSNRYGTEHHEYLVNINAVEVLPKLAWYLDEPMADSSSLPTYFVAQMAKQEVTVVLNGDGGDENFGGYWHQGAVLDAKRFFRLPNNLIKGLIKPAAKIAYDKTNNSFFGRLNGLTDQVDWPDWKLHSYRMELFRGSTKKRIISNTTDLPKVDQEYYEYLYMRTGQLGSVDKLLNAGMMGYLPGDLLVKMDRISMAHSLEARSPFLDHKVIEFSAKMPEKFKINGRQKKVLLKHAAKNYLPNSFLRRRKMGFAIPISKWFQGELGQHANRTLGTPNAKIFQYLNYGVVQGLIKQAMAGDEASSYQVWSLLILEFWLIQNISGEYFG